MDINIESIKWLLYESAISTNKIAKSCHINSNLLKNLRNKKFDLMRLELREAFCLSNYATMMKKANYYMNRRWVVRHGEKLALYEYDALEQLPEDAELVSEVRVTSEIAYFEKLKNIRSRVPFEVAETYINYRFNEAEEDAFRSIGL